MMSLGGVSSTPAQSGIEMEQLQAENDALKHALQRAKSQLVRLNVKKEERRVAGDDTDEIFLRQALKPLKLNECRIFRSSSAQLSIPLSIAGS